MTKTQIKNLINERENSSPEEKTINYITIKEGLRIAWKGEFKNFSYHIEIYNTMLDIWVTVGKGSDRLISDSEILEAVLNHLILEEIYKKDRNNDK